MRAKSSALRLAPPTSAPSSSSPPSWLIAAWDRNRPSPSPPSLVDACGRSSLTGYQGRPGFPYVIEQFAVMLLEEGMEAHDVRKMLVDNAAAALATVAAASGSTQLHREGRR